VLGNPVSGVDPEGLFFSPLTAAAGFFSGLVGGLVVGIVTVKTTNARGWNIFKTIGVNIITGGIIGAMAGAGNLNLLVSMGMETIGVIFSAVISMDTVAGTPLKEDLIEMAKKSCK